MTQSASLYEKLIETFVKWAESQSDIRAVTIGGSRARVDHPADEWADLDLQVITSDKERYLSTYTWITNIGTPLLAFLEPTATGGEVELRVLFEGMLDVDFSIIPQEKVRRFMLLEPTSKTAIEIAATFARGIRVVVDKDGLGEQFRTFISAVKIPTSSPPTEHEFLEVVNDFLYHGVLTAKHLRRGELWWAIMVCNCYMQRKLLQMIEWHARATHGSTYDTWFRGRFLEEWVDPRITAGLGEAFAHYDKKDVRRALLKVMLLFQWIAAETAEKLSYQYPGKPGEQASKWVTDCLSAKECLR